MLKSLIDDTRVRTALIVLCLAVAVYVLWGWLVENILYLFGLGAAGLAYGAKATRARTTASVHEEMADVRLIDSVNEIHEAEAAMKEAQDLAESVEKPNHDNLPPGYRPVDIRTRR